MLIAAAICVAGGIVSLPAPETKGLALGEASTLPPPTHRHQPAASGLASAISRLSQIAGPAAQQVRAVRAAPIRVAEPAPVQSP
jgi:hypothetical protein